MENFKKTKIPNEKQIVFVKSPFSFFYLKINLIKKNKLIPKIEKKSVSFIFSDKNNWKIQKGILREKKIEKEISNVKDREFFDFVKSGNVYSLENSSFSNLIVLFEELFFEGCFKNGVLKSLNHLERVVLLKFIENEKEDFLKEEVSLEKIEFLCKKRFLGSENRYKGYKVTNNKRFMFRKIKDIIFKKKKKIIKGKTGKILKDKDIIKIIFQKADYLDINGYKYKDHNQIKKILSSYRESNLKEIFKFQDFYFLFKKTFNNFLGEMKDSYYKDKIDNLKNFFFKLSQQINLNPYDLKLPWKKLPYNHKSLLEFKNDFLNSHPSFSRDN